MKKGQILVAHRPVDQNAAWDRILEQINGLSIDQRLKLSDNIRSAAIADVKAQQGKLQSELGQLTAMLGETGAGNTPVGRQIATVIEEGGVRGKILHALRKSPMTVSELKQAIKTEWVATPLSQLVQSRQVTNDGQRPATYSLR